MKSIKYFFVYNYRKIQCNMKLDLARNTNCRMFDMGLPENLFYSNIYTVSALRPKLSFDPKTYKSQKDKIVESIQNERDQETLDAFDIVNTTVLDSLGTMNFLIMYHAAEIESKISEILNTDSSVLYCNEENSSCRSVFDMNEKVICCTKVEFYSQNFPNPDFSYSFNDSYSGARASSFCLTYNL